MVIRLASPSGSLRSKPTYCEVNSALYSAASLTAKHRNLSWPYHHTTIYLLYFYNWPTLQRDYYVLEDITIYQSCYVKISSHSTAPKRCVIITHGKWYHVKLSITRHLRLQWHSASFLHWPQCSQVLLNLTYTVHGEEKASLSNDNVKK